MYIYIHTRGMANNTAKLFNVRSIIKVLLVIILSQRPYTVFRMGGLSSTTLLRGAVDYAVP